MIRFHKQLNWEAQHKDGRTVTFQAFTWFFAREAACTLLDCEREDIIDIKEIVTKKESP